MPRILRIILPLALAPSLFANEERIVPVGAVNGEVKIVSFNTPTDANIDNKKLTLKGTGFDPATAKMGSSITTTTAHDGIQWLVESQIGLTHIYKITTVKSTTPLAVIIDGSISDQKPVSVGNGGGSVQRKNKFTVKAPYAAVVSSATLNPAQDDPANARKNRLTVGVAEEIRFTIGATHLGYPAVSSTGGYVYTTENSTDRTTSLPAGTNTFIFRAPGSEQPCTVNLTFSAPGIVSMNGYNSPEGQTIPIQITVIKPTGEEVTKLSMTYPQSGSGDPPLQSGAAGAGMSLEYTVRPKTVSFTNVEVIELGYSTYGQPQNPTGYFAALNTAIPGVLLHKTNTKWVQYEPHSWMDTAGWNEARITTTTPAQQTALKAYGTGKYSWNIPVRWRARLVNNPDFPLYTRTQTFEMKNKQGTITVSKNDSQNKIESVTRTP